MSKTNKPLRLEDLEIYVLAMEIGEFVWEEVSTWEYLHRNHPGNQYVRTADSIAANISEGHGRFFFKEKKQFTYYSRGSLQETKTWTDKSFKRKLIAEPRFRELMGKLETLHYKINSYIKNLKEQ
ncbi:MAG: four helix bundle protein [Saprospiraceae bacterium]